MFLSAEKWIYQAHTGRASNNSGALAATAAAAAAAEESLACARGAERPKSEFISRIN